MDVSIVIVNYNTKDVTLNCLQSIFVFTKGIDYEVVVVDNASVDGSQEAIKTQFPNVTLIESETNLGFGRANNLGVSKSKGKFVFLLNSDVLLIENSVKKMFEFFVENESSLKIGVLGCLLVDESMKINGFGSHFPHPVELNYLKLSKIPFVKFFFKGVRSREYQMNKKCFTVDYVIGADMFLRRNIFDQCGGFDENFFMYYEESDLQFQICKLGLKNYIFTETNIIHLEDGSGKQIKNYSNRKRIITHKSCVYYIKKNFCKQYKWFKFLDYIFLLLNLFNDKYTLKENVDYFRIVRRQY